MADDTAQTRPVVIGGRRALEVQLDRFTVHVEAGPDRGAKATLSAASLTVGTDPSSDLVLSDPTVSRRHAVFTLTRRGIVVDDQESTNGTFIGGVAVRSAIVQDASIVTVGSTPLKVTGRSSPMVVYPGADLSCGALLGRSQAMLDMFALIRQIGRTDLPVLVTGETGSGKELVARALHDTGPRNGKPFLVLDCGAVVHELLRSELFGHERGAFTGADRTSRGLLEEAGGGTVFLDELGELELAVQPNLLRALETREITRIGSKRPIPVDFRIVAATNRNLAGAVAAGTFREDLYYRIACVRIEVPALRDRAEDIPLLATTFLTRFAERNGLPLPPLTDGALQALSAHSWPGNVRQLRNVVELLGARSGGSPVEVGHVREALSGPLRADAGPATPEPDPGHAPGSPSIAAAEREVILRALEQTGGKKKPAAKLLGISHVTLYAKLRRYGLMDPGPDE